MGGWCSGVLGCGCVGGCSGVCWGCGVGGCGGWDNGGRLHLLDPFESSTLLLQLRVGNH